MNAKQALRAASKHIEELEDFNRRSSAEIKALNAAATNVTTICFVFLNSIQ